MAGTGGQLNFKIEIKTLVRLRPEFVNEMDSMPRFLDFAYGSSLLPHPNCIDAEKCVHDKIRKMLDIVEIKLQTVESAPKKFLEALMKSGNQSLAQKLVPEINIRDLQREFNLEISAPPVENQYPIKNFSRYRVQFVKYMSEIPTFIDYALAANLLSDHHKKDIIFSSRNVDVQIRMLYDILKNKLPEKSDAFLFALVKSGNSHLADFIYPNSGDDLDRDFSQLTLAEEQETDSCETSISHLLKNRGRVVIIENIEFSDLGFYRKGNEKDRELLKSFYRELLGFEVIVEQNLTAEEMKSKLHELIHDKKGLSEDYFILFILSHGKGLEITGTDMKSMDYSVIFDEFEKCSFWKDKPKLIYIQACQEYDEKQTKCASSLICQDTNYYLMCAAMPGTISYINTLAGSTFIQSLINVYKKNYLNTDIEKMGIEIKEKVYKIGKGQQIVLCHSGLTKSIYLKGPPL